MGNNLQELVLIIYEFLIESPIYEALKPIIAEPKKVLDKRNKMYYITFTTSGKSS